MKKRNLLIAAILVMHTMGSSLAQASGADLTARQQELMQILEKKGAKQALRQMTDDELRSAREDLRAIINSLRTDFAIAELQDGERAGYKIRNVGLYGVGAAGGVLILGLLDEAVGYSSRQPGPNRGGSMMAGLVFGALIGTASVATTALGQAVVWLTPSEAAAVQDKLDIMVRALNQLDNRLK